MKKTTPLSWSAVRLFRSQLSPALRCSTPLAFIQWGSFINVNSSASQAMIEPGRWGVRQKQNKPKTQWWTLPNQLLARKCIKNTGLLISNKQWRDSIYNRNMGNELYNLNYCKSHLGTTPHILSTQKYKGTNLCKHRHFNCLRNEQNHLYIIFHSI